MKIQRQTQDNSPSVLVASRDWGAGQKFDWDREFALQTGDKGKGMQPACFQRQQGLGRWEEAGSQPCRPCDSFDWQHHSPIADPGQETCEGSASESVSRDL